MTLKDFVLTDTNNFVVCERYLLFFKRIYLVLITKNYLIGLVCNKQLKLANNDELFANKKTNLQALESKSGDALNRFSYLSIEYIRKIENKYLFDQSIFGVQKANFRIDRNDLKRIDFNPEKVDLGEYPNSGTLTLEASRHERKELIVLGNQNGDNIIKWIQTR
ncbi:hypothetical protein ACFOW1_11345 [Parasediminibacterium paludis]|uniref:Uncharacterized protein n=1 Tax=Parasediminibacterium paludis TaxID=908966 RepID=A0ABV8PYG9_9BACT